MNRNVSVLTLASLIILPPMARAERPAAPAAPAVPTEIEAPAGFKPFLIGHAIGMQGYFCVPSGTTFRWTPFGPQATLFTNEGRQQMTHFLSAAPYSLQLGPAWQHSRDSSTVWGQPIATSSDPQYVAPDAIPWLLLEATVVGDGPNGGDALVVTRYIQRVNTAGGRAPSTGCATSTDVAKRELVPYEADYVFYQAARGGRDGRD